MREAVIVSTARTPIGKAYRGGFNNLASPTLAATRSVLPWSVRVSRAIALKTALWVVR